jgi:hypothetical protein
MRRAPAIFPRLERWKPRASFRLQLLLAASLWSVVGTLLLFFGSRWILGDHGTGGRVLLILGAVSLGLMKGRFILDGTARRLTTRILERGDDRCLGGFLSWRSWLLVVVMSGSGRILRSVLLSPVIVGVLYAAIGAWLLFSSRIAWRRWSTAVTL